MWTNEHRQRFARAVADSKLGQAAEALRELMDLEQTAETLDDRAAVLLNEASCYAALGDLSQAQNAVAEALRFLPEDDEQRPFAEFIEAVLCGKGGDLKLAIEKLRAILKTHEALLTKAKYGDFLLDVRYSAARLLAESGECHRALSIFRSIDSDWPVVDAERGERAFWEGACLKECGDFDAAVQHLSRVLTLPVSPTFLFLSRCALGQITYERKEFEQAYMHFVSAENLALTSQLETEALYEWISATLHSMGRHAEAKAYSVGRKQQ